MAIPNSEHVVISGRNPGGEIWAFGFWKAAGSMGPPVGGLDSIPEWAAFRLALNNRMSVQQVITAYDYYTYAGGALVNHGHETVAHAGLDSGGELPLQISCVLTLRSANLTRSGRGRMYLPTNGFSMMSGSDHLFTASVVNDLVDKFAAFISTGAYPGVVISSRTRGVTYPVISVDADYVPDTQRRRRNALTSLRHSAPVT